jgi:hypothetical protein
LEEKAMSFNLIRGLEQFSKANGRDHNAGSEPAVEIEPITSRGMPIDNGYNFPLSHKAFHRGLPRRVGNIEDQLEVHERQIEDLVSRLTTLEARVATVDHLDERVRRLDRRSLRSSRKLAVLADQVEDRLE